jgi:hypothetical protein
MRSRRADKFAKPWVTVSYGITDILAGLPHHASPGWEELEREVVGIWRQGRDLLCDLLLHCDGWLPMEEEAERGGCDEEEKFPEWAVTD